MLNLIKKLILEQVTKTKVICDNCGWSWNIKDGGDDPYVCHNILPSGRMCNHDNTPKNLLNEKCWKGYTQKGMKTMFGKTYPNCVKKLKEDEDYRIQHKTPSKDYGATMDNLTKLYPNDIYSDKALQYYGEGYPYDRLAIAIMQSAKDKPNKKIKIYRAVPKDVNTINDGDWVTTTKQYAQSHGKSVMNNDYKVISKIVNASNLYTDGNSIHEFGYRL
jgi:hypothetical protein